MIAMGANSVFGSITAYGGCVHMVKAEMELQEVLVVVLEVKHFGSTGGQGVQVKVMVVVF
jgi:hypothetical protein